LLRGSFRIVAQVGDGRQAFRAINEHIPQLAVLDMSFQESAEIDVPDRVAGEVRWVYVRSYVLTKKLDLSV
jgi:DNA-binding NarL/FixJ family response regulator